MKLSTGLYIILISILILAYLYFKMEESTNIPYVSEIKKEIIAKEFPKEITISAWLWETPYDMTEEQMINYINKSSEEGINTIYLDVGKYVDIYEDPDENTRNSNIQIFNKKVAKFLEIANSKNIKVEALSGGPNWAEINYSYVPLIIVDYVHNYNKNNSNKFSGIHFDIESWNNEGFDSDKVTGYENYLELSNQLVNENKRINDANNTDTKLSFDVAYWLDNSNDNVPMVNWNHMLDYPLFHLVNILNQDSGNKIVIMAYRNNSDGRNGSIKISKEEIDYVSDNNLNVEILIGQETAQVENEPDSITFFGSSKNHVKNEAANIYNQYQNVKQFKGIAIHHLNSFIDL